MGSTGSSYMTSAVHETMNERIGDSGRPWEGDVDYTEEERGQVFVYLHDNIGAIEDSINTKSRIKSNIDKLNNIIEDINNKLSESNSKYYDTDDLKILRRRAKEMLETLKKKLKEQREK